MTTTPESTKGVPRLEGDPANTLRADHNALADWARDNVDRSVANNAARDAITKKWIGQRVHTQDTNSLWVCTNPAGSGTWLRIWSADGTPFAQAVGQASPSLSAAAFAFTGVTFAAGRFTVAPRIMVTLNTGLGGTQKLIPRAINVTTSGFDLYVYTGDQTNVTVVALCSWHAIQMTPTTANG